MPDTIRCTCSCARIAMLNDIVKCPSPVADDVLKHLLALLNDPKALRKRLTELSVQYVVPDAMVEAACRARWDYRAQIKWDDTEHMKEEWRVEERIVQRAAIAAALTAKDQP